MRWGLATSCCCSPKFAALICFPFQILYFHKTLLYFIPSHSVSHTCTNAEFDVELTGSPQWLRGAQGGGLWPWNRGQKQVLHHSALRPESRSACSASSLFEAVLGRSICLFLVFSSGYWGCWISISVKWFLRGNRVWAQLSSPRKESSCRWVPCLVHPHACCQDTLVLYLFCTFMPVAKVCLYCISSVPSCLLPRYACTVSLLYLHACCQGMLLLHALYSVRYHLRSCVLGLVILTKVKLVSCSVEYAHHSGNVHWIISMVTLFSFAWNHHQKELHSYVARWVFFTLGLVFITVQSNSLLVTACCFTKHVVSYY